MWRVVKMSGQFYAIQVDLWSDMDNIEGFLESDDPVILGGDLETIADILGIDIDEINIIEPD